MNAGACLRVACALTLMGAECRVARSGYTGEDGFEISTPADIAREIAEELLANACVAPIGQAWDLSLARHPSLILHASDGNHSAPAGAFLAALLIGEIKAFCIGLLERPS